MHTANDESLVQETKSSESEALFASETEARIVASLAEKQMTTPDNYPLTLNSLCLACNQKSSREPVMNLSSGEVLRTLRSLEDKRLVDARQSGRTEKFEHRLAKQLGIERAGLSILTVLILRGPQTLVELKTRTKRMFVFEELDDVELAIIELLEKDSPLVKNLGKLNGQREERYSHLLRGDVSIDDIKIPSARKSNEVSELKARVLELEAEIVILKAELAVAKQVK